MAIRGESATATATATTSADDEEESSTSSTSEAGAGQIEVGEKEEEEEEQAEEKAGECGAAAAVTPIRGNEATATTTATVTTAVVVTATAATIMATATAGMHQRRVPGTRFSSSCLLPHGAAHETSFVRYTRGPASSNPWPCSPPFLFGGGLVQFVFLQGNYRLGDSVRGRNFYHTPFRWMVT